MKSVRSATTAFINLGRKSETTAGPTESVRSGSVNKRSSADDAAARLLRWRRATSVKLQRVSRENHRPTVDWRVLGVWGSPPSGYLTGTAWDQQRFLDCNAKETAYILIKLLFYLLDKSEPGKVAYVL